MVLTSDNNNSLEKWNLNDIYKTRFTNNRQFKSAIQYHGERQENNMIKNRNDQHMYIKENGGSYGLEIGCPVSFGKSLAQKKLSHSPNSFISCIWNLFCSLSSPTNDLRTYFSSTLILSLNCLLRRKRVQRYLSYSSILTPTSITVVLIWPSLNQPNLTYPNLHEVQPSSIAPSE